MRIIRASSNIEFEAERVLRSLPMWFGQEESTLEYIRDTSLHPTFMASNGDAAYGFITLKQHFPQAYEIHCIAVHAASRGTGVGRALAQHAEAWAYAQGARFIQVKTLADSHPSPEYAQTRAFYQHLGFTPLELFPTLWGEGTPCLQLIKQLAGQVFSHHAGLALRTLSHRQPNHKTKQWPTETTPIKRYCHAVHHCRCSDHSLVAGFGYLIHPGWVYPRLARPCDHFHIAARHKLAALPRFGGPQLE